MVRARLPGVNTVRKRLADGSVRHYYYHRATGERLTGEPGTPEFVTSYVTAENRVTDYTKGTLASLVRRYILSPEFAKLADRTQREYRRVLTKAEVKFATLPIAALDDPKVRRVFMEWRASIAATSGDRESDNCLSVVSALLTWCQRNGLVTANHVKGFQRLHKVDRSDRIWLRSDIEAFMAVAPIELQRALILALHTGQRQGDLLALTWNNFDGERITLRQGKTGRAVEVPCTEALRGTLATTPRKAVVILTTSTGAAWTARYFGRRWKEASDAAGLVDLHFHDLRGTAITMLAEAGCSVPEIASITGHSFRTVSAILDKYLSRTRTLATSAIARFENASATDFANRLQTTGDGNGGSKGNNLK